MGAQAVQCIKENLVREIWISCSCHHRMRVSHQRLCRADRWTWSENLGLRQYRASRITWSGKIWILYSCHHRVMASQQRLCRVARRTRSEKLGPRSCRASR